MRLTTDTPEFNVQSDPSTRGTWGIFSTCLSTLIICVWTAVHVDTPAERSLLWSILVKLGWMIIGLFAPELLLLLAYRQWAAAQGLMVFFNQRRCNITPEIPWYQRIFNRLTGMVRRRAQGPKDSEAGKKHMEQPLLDHNSNERQFQSPWTLTHAFYACMGGYAFDFPEVKEADSFLPSYSFPPAFPSISYFSFPPAVPAFSATHTRRVISPYGIKFLVNHFPHLLPEVSDDNICDRDQGSSLAKTISLVQLLWFCVNCASRRTQGLPISLLEVTTLAHAICMFVTYLFWFDKPLDVNGPTLIADTPEARQVCALMSMMSAKRIYILGGMLSWNLPAEMSSLEIVDHHAEPLLSSSVENEPTLDVLGSSSSAVASLDDLSVVEDEDASYPISVGFSRCIEGTIFAPIRPPLLPILFGESRRTNFRIWSTQLAMGPSWNVESLLSHKNSIGREDVIRWKLAAKALRRYWRSQSQDDNRYQCNGSGGAKRMQLVLHEDSSLHEISVEGTTSSDADSPPRIKTTFETALYDMPNLPKGVNNDQVLLRPNSSLQSFILGDAVPGVEGVYRSGLATPLLYAMYGIPHFIGWKAVFPTSIEQTLWRTATIFITGWGVILCIAVILIFRLYPHPKWGFIHVLIAFYGAASVYVVTESLRQLFYLPPGAYELPSWSNYWPHFS